MPTQPQESPDNWFRTLEAGNVPCATGRLQFATVKSPALKARADVTIYTSAQAIDQTGVPVVMLLHGVYSSHWAWAFAGNAHRTLQALVDSGEVPPMILGMPSDGLWGDGSGYVPHVESDFESWISEDVPRAISRITGNALVSPHFIAGLSMGGFGAMRIGASHPERFAGFAGHSSITELGQMEAFVEEPLQRYQEVIQSDPNVLDVLLRHRDSLRPFRFDCGAQDDLLEANRALHTALTRAGIECTYEEFPGAHDWIYWEAGLARTLRFFASVLKAGTC